MISDCAICTKRKKLVNAVFDFQIVAGRYPAPSLLPLQMYSDPIGGVFPGEIPGIAVVRVFAILCHDGTSVWL
jgi:hypothetical protein